MALSNILKEPRRELTETVVGIVGVIPFCYLDYKLAKVIVNSTVWVSSGLPPFPLVMLLAALMLFAGTLIIVIATHAIHGLGNTICNKLDRIGLRLRPIKRY